MDSLSQKFYDELCNLTYWQKSYERIVQTEKYSTDTIEQVFAIMNSEKYKKIAKQLATGTYKFSTPEKVLIAKSESTKKRIIYKYAEIDRFIMSLLYRVTSSIFADKISPKCFSYKQGTNTADAIASIQRGYTNKKYGVKMDIHAYFNSVNKEHLYACIDELFPKDASVRKTFEALYMNDNITFRGKPMEEYKSLIPGSAIGSFWANYCLREVDAHFEELGVPYARYSDDIIIFGDSEEETHEFISWILDKISAYGLTINEDKFTYFDPETPVEFLGLRFDTHNVDISNHAKMKIKKTIKRWCKKARKDMEINNKEFIPTAKAVCNRFNWRIYKTYIQDTTRFGWAYYAFRYINNPKSLIELDNYYKDTLRAMKTGRHNKKNFYAISEDEFHEIGYISFIEMYNIFKSDFDYYCDIVARM